MSFVRKLASASFWLTIASWVSSAVGLLTMLIFARILSVEEFGLIATATLVTAFFDLFSRLGTEAYLIKEVDPDTEDINTAWTIQLIIKLLIALAIYLFSNRTSLYFNEPQIENILKTLALIPLLLAFTNIGIALLKKEMAFQTLMYWDISAKISSFLITLVLIIVLDNYWAYIWGMVSYYVIISSTSYYFSHYRPKLCLTRLHKQIGFSQWTLLKGIVNYFNNKCDQLIISKFIGSAALGAFSITQRIYETASDILVSPFIATLYPGLGQLDRKSPQFTTIFHNTLIATSVVIILLASLLAINAEQLVTIALGSAEKWHLVANLLPLAAPLLITRILSFALFDVLTLLDKIKFLFKFELVTAIISSIVLFLAVYWGDIETLVIARIFLTALSCLVLLFVLQRLISLSVSVYLIESIPLIIAATIAYLVTAPLQIILISKVNDLVCVFATSFVYTTTYFAVLISFISILKSHSTTYALIAEQLSKLKLIVWQKLTTSDTKQT
ncbi:oligosaccharide flippase family protein [Photobacterium swingsii]|uniref:oligosaccharide flippase family protein n=1 Tax=Photobacterium swingsii TaxID=680026 RepID=UPI004068EE86